MLGAMMFAMPVMASNATPTQANILTPISQNQIQYSINKNLNSKQIAERFTEINSKYALYQPFSAVDAEFVRTYANPANTVSAGSISPMSSKTQSFSKSDTTHTVQTSFYGSVSSAFDVNGNVLLNSYGGNITAAITGGKSNWRGTTLVITCTAYGLVGSGGIGMVYNGQISGSTTTASTYTLNQSQLYSALAAYAYVDAEAIINTNSGSYSIWAF
jgi:hypothetical protein